MVTNDNVFIYVCIYTVERHCIHCKQMKTDKNVKNNENNVTALKGLKNVYIMACESESEI